jgi:hypothetical protein
MTEDDATKVCICALQNRFCDAGEMLELLRVHFPDIAWNRCFADAMASPLALQHRVATDMQTQLIREIVQKANAPDLLTKLLRLMREVPNAPTIPPTSPPIRS